MASREEEKRRRREERLALEQAEAVAGSRRKRLRLALGGLLAISVIAGLVALVAITLGGATESDAEPETPGVAGAELPEQQIGDLKDAAKAAGCELKNPDLEPAGHEPKAFTAADYKTNPPTSGNHTPDWYEDGIYEPGNAPDLGKTVHTLEHGRIDVQYRRGTPTETIKELEALLAEQNGGYHMLLFQNETGMPYAVAATAWGHMVGCKVMKPAVFDALRTFRTEYVDKGPEAVP